ncbi:hypothetical protein AJ79_10318 [Helicocarpus griseus UAMH5409]|uniref:Uncharacterized protein n=1 Tax=Helicocarpus griseus UAMH5409 TaxID=1447875 RepID=A0A2B7WEC6_9EURO|nr:hypothetical protein AJ79_10318 [Helicocarpus griseus UAMH5409]
MALPRRWTYLDSPIGHGQIHLPRWPITPHLSMTPRTWHGNTLSQDIQHQQLLYSTTNAGMFDPRYTVSAESKFLENKCDPRDSINHWNPMHVETRLDGLPGPMICPDTTCPSAAEYVPENQTSSSSFCPAMAVSRSQGYSNYSNIPTAEQPLLARPVDIQQVPMAVNTPSTYPSKPEWLRQIGNNANFNEQQSQQRWASDMNNPSCRLLSTYSNLSIPLDDWNEWHHANPPPAYQQYSPNSSFSSPFTPDTVPDLIDPGYFDMQPPTHNEKRQPEWYNQCQHNP